VIASLTAKQSFHDENLGGFYCIPRVSYLLAASMLCAPMSLSISADTGNLYICISDKFSQMSAHRKNKKKLFPNYQGP
jgi:hypothetical protein